MKTIAEELLGLSGWLSQQADYWDNQDYHSAKPRYVEKANYVRDLATRCEGLYSADEVEKAVRGTLKQWPIRYDYADTGPGVLNDAIRTAIVETVKKRLKGVEADVHR